MIGAALLVLMLDGPAAVTAPTCPMAAPPDALVSCPGWRTRRARTRNAKGEIIRSRSVLAEFKRATGYPSGRPGFVVDHVRALACGGVDAPWNMAWQSDAEGKAKDRWELKVCGR